MIFGTLCVLIKSSQKHQHNLSTRDVTKVYVFPGKQLFQAVGTLCAAFAAQHHLFYGLHVLRDRTWSGFQRITIGAVFFSFTLALILGISGFLAFMDTISLQISVWMIN
jgi:hypothetical protein